MAPHEQFGDVLCFSSVVLSSWPQEASIVLPLGGILSLCETPEWYCGLENVTSKSYCNKYKIILQTKKQEE